MRRGEVVTEVERLVDELSITGVFVAADVSASNWQWIAGTGTDTRPNRVLNPIRQALRYDPDGNYVRRWIPELAHISGSDIHEPAAAPHYPQRILDHLDGAREFKAARARGGFA